MHGGHLGGCRRLAPRHIDERLVGEHHIGGDALLFGQGRAALAQRLEQRRVARLAVGQRRGVGDRACGLFRGGFERVLAQRDLVRALEHAPAGVRDRPGAVAGDIEGNDPGAVELAKNRAPFLLAVFLADAKSRQAIVTESQNSVAVIADQHIGQMLGAEALAGAHDGGERLLRGDGTVDDLGTIAAEIAIAAWLCGLAEIGQQRLPAAARRFAQRHQRVEALALDPLLLVGGIAVVDLQTAQADVAHPVERQRVGGEPIAAGAADLLVIAFDIGWHIGVQHEAHVRLVDAHAESDSRDHDDTVLLQENILVTRARLRLHAGVIGQRLDAGLAQIFGQFLGLAPRRAIDDAALAGMIFDEIRNLLAAADFGLHRQAQVRPVETVHKHSWRPLEQLRLNIGARGGVRRGGERHRLHAAERRLHGAQRGIFGAEVVAPLRDAVRLIDRQQRDLGLFQKIDRVRFQQTFRRHIDEAQFAARDLIEDRPVFRRIVRRVERRRGDAIAAQLRHLIAHQRDERRHHDGEAVTNERRQLIAQRLAAAGRHHRQHVATVENGADDIALPRPKGLEAEGLVKRALCRREVGHVSSLGECSIFVP